MGAGDTRAHQHLRSSVELVRINARLLVEALVSPLEVELPKSLLEHEEEHDQNEQATAHDQSRHHHASASGEARHDRATVLVPGVVQLGTVLPGLDEHLLGHAAGRAGHAFEVGLTAGGVVDLRERLALGHLELHHLGPTLRVGHDTGTKGVPVGIHPRLPEGLALLAGELHFGGVLHPGLDALTVSVGLGLALGGLRVAARLVGGLDLGVLRQLLAGEFGLRVRTDHGIVTEVAGQRPIPVTPDEHEIGGAADLDGHTIELEAHDVAREGADARVFPALPGTFPSCDSLRFDDDVVEVRADHRLVGAVVVLAKVGHRMAFLPSERYAPKLGLAYLSIMRNTR